MNTGFNTGAFAQLSGLVPGQYGGNNFLSPSSGATVPEMQLVNGNFELTPGAQLAQQLAGPSEAAGFNNWFSMDGALGKTFKDGSSINGWGGAALGAASSLFGAWNGMEQNKLARESLNFQKEAFNRNFENQRKLTNSSLRDRQNARLGANPNGYEATDSYLAKNGV